VGEPGRRRARRGCVGTVTAEAAIVLPLVAAVALAMVWFVSLGITQVQAADAARDAARALARGEAEPSAEAAARRTATTAARVTISHHGNLVTVTVAVAPHVPSWLLLPLPAPTLTAHSTVEVEGASDI
jgi:Flp pilus assembly protein TadG